MDMRNAPTTVLASQMSDPAWVPEARDVPAELVDKFDRADYPPKPIHFVPLQDKLTGNEWEALKAYARQASIGEPETEHGTTNAG